MIPMAIPSDQRMPMAESSRISLRLEPSRIPNAVSTLKNAAPSRGIYSEEISQPDPAKGCMRDSAAYEYHSSGNDISPDYSAGDTGQQGCFHGMPEESVFKDG